MPKSCVRLYHRCTNAHRGCKRIYATGYAYRQNPHLKAGAGGRNRTGTGLSALRIFVPLLLSPPPSVVWTVPSPWLARFRCRPSRLYTFPRWGLARLPAKVSPNLSSSAPWASPRGLINLSSLRLPVSPRSRAPSIRRKDSVAMNETAFPHTD